jgi:hypothetical protein
MLENINRIEEKICSVRNKLFGKPDALEDEKCTDNILQVQEHIKVIGQIHTEALNEEQQALVDGEM